MRQLLELLKEIEDQYPVDESLNGGGSIPKPKSHDLIPEEVVWARKIQNLKHTWSGVLANNLANKRSSLLVNLAVPKQSTQSSVLGRGKESSLVISTKTTIASAFGNKIQGKHYRLTLWQASSCLGTVSLASELLAYQVLLYMDTD